MGVDYSLEYIPGHLNYLADFMSRAIVQEPSVSHASEASVNTTQLVSKVDWVVEQGKDEEILGVMRCLKFQLADREWLKVPNGLRFLMAIVGFEKRNIYTFLSKCFGMGRVNSSYPRPW